MCGCVCVRVCVCVCVLLGVHCDPYSTLPIARHRVYLIHTHVSVNYRHLMYGGHSGEVDHSELVGNKHLDSSVRTKTMQHNTYAN